jgi:hypothetical protein
MKSESLHERAQREIEEATNKIEEIKKIAERDAEFFSKIEIKKSKKSS